MMNPGTRRMWSRRFLRAGWLVAPIFAFPSTMWNRFRNIQWRKIDWAFAIFMLVMCSFAGALAHFLHRDAQRYKPADAAEIKAAAKADQCVAQQIAERLATGFVIKRYEFVHFASRCDDARAVQQQIEAIK